jgi:hypothetical protein
MQRAGAPSKSDSSIPHTYPKNTNWTFMGRVFHHIGSGIEGLACGVSALTIGTISSHFFGKTLEGFTVVEIIPRVVHSLQEYAPVSHIAHASTYYLTGITTPYVLNGVGLIGGSIGAVIGYYVVKGVIDSIKTIAKTVLNLAVSPFPI